MFFIDGVVKEDTDEAADVIWTKRRALRDVMIECPDRTFLIKLEAIAL